MNFQVQVDIDLKIKKNGMVQDMCSCIYRELLTNC